MSSAPMPTNFSYDVFISYTSSDLAFAEQLHGRLVDAGFRVWFDKARLNPGCDWHREIEAGCDSSRVILPVLTPRWKASKWTKFETYGADCVIPIIAEGNAADVSTPPITRFQAQQIDFADGAESQWQRLIEAIRIQLGNPEPDKVQRLADVRYQANPHFVGRESELLQIHEELHGNPSAALTQGRVRAIAALGGVGKTTLAREYIEQFWRCYSQILWVDCRKGIETELARICDFLLPHYRTETDIPAKAKFAYQQLLDRQERLLIYDNAEDETSLQSWIPKTGHCRTLITSRFSAWSAGIKTIHLHVLDSEPAWALLVGRAGRGAIELLDGNEQAACKELAEMLGYLPLALEQAGAYIEQQGFDFLFADYLRLYKSATEELLTAGVLGSTEYPDSVVTTWKATVAKLSPVAQAILRLCSFMAPTPIPLWLLINSAVEILAESELALPQGNAEAFIRKHVQQLRAYSMVSGEGKSLHLHALVQAVERLQTRNANRYEQVIESVLKILCREGNLDAQDVVQWPVLEALRSHILIAVEFAGSQPRVQVLCGFLLGTIGLFDYHKGQYSAARLLMRRALDVNEQSYGPEHPNVATALNNLAQLLQATNRLAEAEPLMRRALAIDEQSFGPKHPKVARDLNNLAHLFQATNRLAEAEPLMRRVLAIDEQSYGPEHPNVARDLNNLALLLEDTNRLSEAEPLMRRALSIDEQSHGSEHPNVARDLNNLAHLLQATNRLAEAEPLMRRALSIDEQSYGPEHPNVAVDLNNLAQLLQDTNRLTEAEPLMRRALSIDEQSYGPEHPSVAIRLSNLASLLQDTHRRAEAEPLMRRALAICEIFNTSTGYEHPNFRLFATNYRVLLKEMGKSQSEIDQIISDLADYYS